MAGDAPRVAGVDVYIVVHNMVPVKPWLGRNRNSVSALIDRRGRKRDDVITSAGLVFSQELRVDPDHGDLIVHFIFNWSDYESNVRASDRSKPFSYDKIVAGIQFEWRF